MDERSKTAKQNNGPEILEFDDYSPGEIIVVPLEGESRKGKPYRVIHRLRVPDNTTLRKYNNRLGRIEQSIRGRRQRKGGTVKIRIDTSGADEWLWSQVIEDVQGYPGGKDSVPIDHKTRALEYILPELGYGGEENEEE